MTVKELIEVLEACNQESDVWITDDSGSTILKDEDIYQDASGESITIDISVASLAYKGEKQ